MTSKPIFPAAALAALMWWPGPGLAGGTAMPCTGGFAEETMRHKCPEDIPPAIAQHAEQDPFMRKPQFTVGSGWGHEVWYQDGLWHHSRWKIDRHAHTESVYWYQIVGSNDNDKVRLQKFHKQAPNVYGLGFDMPDGREKPRMLKREGITFFSGGGNDTVYGTTGNDVIRPYSPHDMDIAVNHPSVKAKGGSFMEMGCWGSTHQRKCELLTNTGTKRYFGLAGNDRLYGGVDADWLKGGRGDDYLHGGPGDDFLFGGPGNDKLVGGPGSDFMAGGGGKDTYDLSGYENGDRDVILADKDDKIWSQALFREAHQWRTRIDVADVTMPSIDLGGRTWTLDASSLASKAWRIDGADIVYRAGD